MMKKLASRSEALLASVSIAGAASAQSGNSWDGLHAGLNAGAASNSGVEIALTGPWSIGAEYLHANLGNESSSTTSCTGSASACAEFSGISVDSLHNGFTANIIRVDINYWFGY